MTRTVFPDVMILAGALALIATIIALPLLALIATIIALPLWG